MSTSNVPSLQITGSGVTVPDPQTILNGVLADYNSAFGNNLNITSSGTPQRVLSSDTTDYITSANSAISFLCSMIDPSTSQGRYQDAIGRIYYIYRKPATSTVVTGLCTGQPGSILPIGSQATDGTYNYITTNEARFNSGGTVSVNFSCTTLGDIQCSANSMNRIKIAVNGWDAVTNPSAGVLGSNVESQSAFEARRYNSTALNSHGTISSILGAVINLPNVLDCYVLDNELDTEKTVGPTSYPMKKNSLLVSVVGGDSKQIAKAIFDRKSPGCNMNGNVSVNVTDTSSLAFPQPVYEIKFLNPASLSVYFIVNIVKNDNLPSDIIDLIKKSIISKFNGSDGSDRARIASSLYASSYYATVSNTSSFTSIISIFLGTDPNPTGVSLLVGVDQAPTIQDSNIKVNLI